MKAIISFSFTIWQLTYSLSSCLPPTILPPSPYHPSTLPLPSFHPPPTILPSTPPLPSFPPPLPYHPPPSPTYHPSLHPSPIILHLPLPTILPSTPPLSSSTFPYLPSSPPFFPHFPFSLLPSAPTLPSPLYHGFSSFMQHLIQTRTPLTKITATSGLTLSSLELQRIVTDKISQLQKRTGPQKSKHSVERKSVFFIDDLHLVSSQSQGELPSVAETLCYMTSSSVIMDPVRNYKHSLYNVQYIATCSISDVPHLNARMMTTFHRVPLLPPTENTLFKIFLQSIRGWVESFSIENIVDPLAEVRLSDALTSHVTVCPFQRL